MRPLYFCANCKQYHNTCNKTISRSSSVRYLRFADLFNAVPAAHPQNFTMTSPKMVENSRLVYDDNASFAGTDSGAAKFYNNCGQIKSGEISRMTVEVKSYSENKNNSKFKPTNQANSRAKPNHSAKHSRMNTSYAMNNQDQQYKKQIYNKNKSITAQKYTPKLPDNNKKGPYYVVANLKKRQQASKIKITEQSTFVEKTNKKVNKNEPTTTNVTTSKKNSYIYGNSERNILVPEKCVKQFKYGELIESRQQVVEEQVYVHEQDINQVQRFKESSSFNLVKPSDISSHGKQEIIEYSNKLNNLKERLKGSGNKSYYKQKEIPVTPTHSRNQINIKINQSSQLSDQQPQPFKKPVKNVHQMHQHQLKSQNIKQCRYLDNRCLGINFCEEGEVHFIQGIHQLK